MFYRNLQSFKGKKCLLNIKICREFYIYIKTIRVTVLGLDITLPSLYMTVSGSILTTAPYVQRLPMLSLNVSLTFCSTCGESSPFHPHCDVVSPTRSPVLAMRASTTMTMIWMWNERKRTEWTFLASLARSEQPSGKNKRSPYCASSALRSEDGDSSAYHIY